MDYANSSISTMGLGKLQCHACLCMYMYSWKTIIWPSNYQIRSCHWYNSVGTECKC